MALIGDEVFSSAAAMIAVSQAFASTQTIFKGAVAIAVLTAALTGARTATISTTGKTSVDVQYVTELLNQAGYQASVTGSSLAVSW